MYYFFFHMKIIYQIKSRYHIFLLIKHYLIILIINFDRSINITFNC